MAGGRGNKSQKNQQKPEKEQKPGSRSESKSQPAGSRGQPNNTVSKSNGRSARKGPAKQQRNPLALGNADRPNQPANEYQNAGDMMPGPQQKPRVVPSHNKAPEKKANCYRVRGDGCIPIALAITNHRKNNHGKIKHSPDCIAAMQMRFQKLNNFEKIHLVPVPVSFFKSNGKMAAKAPVKPEIGRGNTKIHERSDLEQGPTKDSKIATMVYERRAAQESSSTIRGVAADGKCLTIYEKSGKGQHQFPLMQVRGMISN